MAKRFIDADALLKELDLIEMNTQVSIKQGDKNYKLCQKGILSGLNWCRNIIYEIPTADVVEVVRCKDCQYANDCGTICRYGVGRDVKPDHFCGYGERRKDKEGIEQWQ